VEISGEVQLEVRDRVIEVVKKSTLDKGEISGSTPSNKGAAPSEFHPDKGGTQRGVVHFAERLAGQAEGL